MNVICSVGPEEKTDKRAIKVNGFLKNTVRSLLAWSHLCLPLSILEESPQTLEGIDWGAGRAIVGSYLQISRIFEHLLHNLWGQTILGKS